MSCLSESLSDGVKLVVGVLKATMYAVAGLPRTNHPCLDLKVVSREHAVISSGGT